MAGTKTSTRQRVKATDGDASPIIKTIQQILERAVKSGASDVHIEPRAGYGVVRQRIDGMLQVTTKLPGASFGTVVTQLKKMAKLNTVQKLAPQAGHYSVSIGRQSYEVHVATLPVMDGERVALHIADAAREPVTLEELGYWGSALQHINHALAQPHGLILVSSNDQTSTLLTLGSMLRALSSPDLNLASVEQNVVYQMPHVNQTVVKKEIGMTFARRLKQILASEPNVVMVSDVLDSRTAKAIITAAASRQLVLAGIHASNTVSAINGLVHLSKTQELVANSLQVAVSQKLVPKLCPDCREAYEPSVELIGQLAKIFGTNTPARMQKLHKLELDALAEQLGVNPSQPISAKPSTSEQHIIRLWRARAGGCKSCDQSGFKARITINEVVPHSNSLQNALQLSPNINELRTAARSGDMIPLAQDALVKALRGLVPIETVLASTSSKKL